MAYEPQLFYGKLSSFSATNDNITVITGDVDNSTKDITNVAAFNSSFDVNLLRVGQILGDVNNVYNTSTVTIEAINGTTITVDQFPNQTGTGKIFTADTPEGIYYFASASFSDPNNNITINNITGSNDSEYNSSLSNKFGIIGRAKKGSTLQNGTFLPYIITEVLHRDTNIISGFLEWGDEGVESDSGYTLDLTSNRNVPIVETTPSASAIPMFDTQVLTGLSTAGAGFSGWQQAVNKIIDKADTGSAAGSGFPFTGSAVITGSLTISGDKGEQDFFLVKSSSFTSFKISSSHVPVFGNFITTPSAIAGGFIYSGSNFYVGIE